MTKKEELKEVILQENVRYEFEAMTTMYGNAEFCVCPVFKRGKLREFHMFPMQQPNAKSHFKKEFTGKYTPRDFQLTSWADAGLGDPRIWLNFWCKEHKCCSFRLYVPKNAKYFEVLDMSSFDIKFGSESAEQTTHLTKIHKI